MGALLSSALLLGGWLPGVALAAPVLTAADAVIRFSSATQCEVTLTLTVSGAAEMEHRLESLEGSRAELLDVTGADRVGEVRDIGRTQALVVRPSQASYTIHYRVEQTPSRPGRCPIWLPTAPADGRSRNVRMRVSLPPGQTAGGTMPTFVWNGAEGAATLPHLPAFVIVPSTADGSGRPWDVSRVMDAVAVGTLVVASAIWLRRQQRHRA